MPCYRCGARQVDPEGGESPWRRGVREERQVLICPGCQATLDWAGELDHCTVCSSVHLVRRLGEVECRDCGQVGSAVGENSAGQHSAGQHRAAYDGAVRDSDGHGSAGSETGPEGAGHDGAGHNSAGPDSASDATLAVSDVPPGLAEEVEQALARVLGRSKQHPPYAMS